MKPSIPELIAKLLLTGMLMLGLLALLFVPLAAQDSTALDRYIRIAIENNRELIERNLDLSNAKEEARRAKANFMPDVDISATYDLANGGRLIEIPVGDLLNPVHGAVNNLAGQDLLPTDLGVQTEQFLADEFHETKIRIMQPLFNTDIYFGYKARKELVSAEQARRDAYITELTKEVKTAYYNYLKTEEVMEIHRTTRKLLNENLNFNRDLVKNGKATRDAVSSAQFELSELESEVAETKRQREQARSFFNFLLSRPLETPIEKMVQANRPTTTLELETLQQQAITRRDELQQLEYGIEAQNQVRKLEKGDAIPELFAVADVGYQGFGYEFDGKQDFWFVRFGLKWDLFEGFKNRADIQQSKIEVKKLNNRYNQLRDQIRLQVINALDAYRAAEEQLNAREASLQSARDRFQIVRNRYEENQALQIEFLDARTKFTNARIQVAIARYDLEIAFAELQRAIGNA